MKEYFEKVIVELNNEFDTHKFIEKFISTCEKKYVELLCSHIKSNGIFRATHSEIGKYLANNASLLGIEKLDRINSKCIKKYDTENQNWRKLV